jgi:capsular exopolysaccharide synthesis family protein
MIEDYIRNNRSVNRSKIIPSNFDISDAAFNNQIQKYNDLQQKKQKNDFITFKENTESSELDNELNEVKASILEAAASLKNAKKLKIKNYTDKYDTDISKLSTLPDREKVLQDINRQKQIKEKLYLYLLQKREETAIASISTTSNYQAMDAAGSSRIPIEPKVGQIRTFAIAIGLLFPIAFIYLLDMLNDKITTRQDIIAKTPIPIAGEISHVDNNETIVVENSRNIVAEQFRILRSNLQFILTPNDDGTKKHSQTLLVTSSVSGEGKSFISLNLAAVLSLTGKKVALLAFDLRKLKGLKLPDVIEDNNRGITNYLIGQTNDIASIYQIMPKHPSLHVYNTGPIPPNPAELIISPRMEILFAYLKEQYDYIVIDSAPIGLVSDSFALSKYTDTVMYIVRQRYTFKKQIEFVNDLYKEGKLANMAIVVNDVNLAGRYGYYGYGYGYGYGYMYRYGLGYGYSRYIYGGKKKDPYFDANKRGYFDDTVKLSWWQKLFGK